MSTQTVEIVDRGRGPQLSTSRITVLDVFYYLHRGYDYDFISRAMPSLTREELEAVNAYAASHHEELVEKDQRAEEFHRRGIESQKARGGVFTPSDETSTTEERVARLREKMKQKLGGPNGACRPG